MGQAEKNNLIVTIYLYGIQQYVGIGHSNMQMTKESQ